MNAHSTTYLHTNSTLTQESPSDRGEMFINQLNESYNKLTKEEADILVVAGFMLMSYFGANVQQQQAGLNNFLKHAVVKQLPQLHLTALQFASENLSSQNETTRNVAQKVFMTFLSICRDLNIKAHSAEHLNQASMLLLSLDRMPRLSDEQVAYLSQIVTAIQPFLNDSEISSENCIRTAFVINNFIGIPTQVLQQEIFLALSYIVNTITTREQEIRVVAIKLLRAICELFYSYTKNKSSK
ncbi:MAG: hypothetical protein LBD36_02235 [Holosporales bacterium]|jgi:hypothetical protein|nr:hypothetical protein [Holosporales bacterium]